MTGRDFWSRRKAAVRAEAEAARAREDVPDAGAGGITGDTVIDDATILENLGLPDPDSLHAGDDFSGFMARAVPEHLRRRALRRLWVSNPVLANTDGLVDYGEDFTNAAKVMPDMQTAYQVGRGMMRHVEALMQPAADGAITPEDHPDPAPLHTGEDLIPVEDAESLNAEPAEPAPATSRPPRHMRFEYS